MIDSRIDWTMTYDHRSDFWWPRARLKPVTRQHRSQAQVQQLEHSFGFAQRSGILLGFISGCYGQRMQLWRRLESYLPNGTTRLCGKCGQKCCPNNRRHSGEVVFNDACHRALFAKYRFYASFENSRCSGYITEKVWRPLEHIWYHWCMAALTEEITIGSGCPAARMCTRMISSLRVTWLFHVECRLCIVQCVLRLAPQLLEKQFG